MNGISNSSSARLGGERPAEGSRGTGPRRGDDLRPADALRPGGLRPGNGLRSAEPLRGASLGGPGDPLGAADPAHARCVADFERLLRSKGGWPGADEADGACAADAAAALAQADTPAPGASSGTLPAGLQAAAAPDAPGAPRTLVDPTVASRFELDAAANADPFQGRSFQVSVNERLGVPLEFRVVQPGAADPSGRWALSIGSSHLNPDLLRRYTGRLDERLRLKALTDEPVRIEHDEDE